LPPPGARRLRAAISEHSNPLREICVGHNVVLEKNRRGNLELLKKLGAQFDFNVIGNPAVTVNGELVSSTQSAGG